MPKLPRLRAQEAENLLLMAGFQKVRERGKGAHRLYKKDNKRIILTFHSGKLLHPKTVKQVMQFTEKY